MWNFLIDGIFLEYLTKTRKPNMAGNGKLLLFLPSNIKIVQANFIYFLR